MSDGLWQGYLVMISYTDGNNSSSDPLSSLVKLPDAMPPLRPNFPGLYMSTPSFGFNRHRTSQASDFPGLYMSTPSFGLNRHRASQPHGLNYLAAHCQALLIRRPADLRSMPPRLEIGAKCVHNTGNRTEKFTPAKRPHA
eukprot:1161917-Pelagomonas_calceolata.AAC.18